MEEFPRNDFTAQCLWFLSSTPDNVLTLGAPPSAHTPPHASPDSVQREVMSDGFRVAFTFIVTGLMFLQFATMMGWVAVDLFPGLSYAESSPLKFA